jgi:2,3-bisphosphoglycerate-dependent phosphoglycerate mutase
MGDEEKPNPFTVLVCGGGNAAQVGTAMFAARYNTIAVSLYADEASKWKAALGDDEYELTLDTGKVLKSKPNDITNDPSVAANADMIVLAVPSFAHGQYFEAFEPYIKPDTVVACMPARSGGDILLASKLGAKAETCIFVGFETLPWACRFTEWGRKATILGTKGSILAAVTPPAKTPKAFAGLQGLLGVFPNVAYSPNNLGISLRNPGAVIHPGVMYGRWCSEKWDGAALTEKPLFYQGVEEFSEGVLLGLTGEVQKIKQKMEELVSGLDLKDAVDLKQWYMDCYAGQMTDTSSLRACMNTNPGYRGLTHPCKDVEGGFVPDLKYRYLTEDVPTGMCFNKGLAEILGIETPMTDKVITWAQDCIGMDILVGGKMAGKDIAKTRAPQATGISTLEAFLKAAKIDKAALAKTGKVQTPSLPPPAESEEKNPFCVLVCGGGNAAQVATAMFASRVQTIAVSLYADEAAKWKAALGDDSYELTLDTGKVITSKPDDITNDPSVAAKADAIVLAVPSFAHGQYFDAFAPYMKQNCVVAVMPARSGGDILFSAKLGAKAKDMIFVGFETLPWACRFTEWGRKATVLGTKGSILAAVTPPSRRPFAFSVLQGLLGVFPNVTESPNNLGISLRNPGAVIHPGVMYGRWCSEKWDGQPLAEKPLFYQGVEEFSESILLGLTGEVQLIKKKMEELCGLDLKDACDLKQWYMDCYAGQMTDTSSLRACMNTNPGYKGLTHPMKDAEGKFMPDLKYRYLTEDVPTGMCFNKGLAEILGVATPVTDKVIGWAQDCIGMKIFVDGKMNGPDIGKTRAPQALGITTLDGFLAAASIVPAQVSNRIHRVVFLRHGESVWNVANIFTGWADVDLSENGMAEAVEAGKCLKEKGIKFDVVFTSVLRRAIKTAWTVLSHSENFTMPIVNTWRLNERHYGALQGLNKAETAAKHGDEQVKIWRRSYDIPPPPIERSDERHPANDPLYAGVPKSALPGAESLKLTVDRVLPFWFDQIAPCIMAGRTCLVAAHGNSLRALCKYIENMSEAEVLDLNIPTSVPLVYELDENLKFLRKYYLMDPEEVAKKMAAVANQGKAK